MTNAYLLPQSILMVYGLLLTTVTIWGVILWRKETGYILYATVMGSHIVGDQRRLCGKERSPHEIFNKSVITKH